MDSAHVVVREVFEGKLVTAPVGEGHNTILPVVVNGIHSDPAEEPHLLMNHLELLPDSPENQVIWNLRENFSLRQLLEGHAFDLQSQS